MVHYNYLIAAVANPFEEQGNNLLQLQMLLKGIKRNTTSTSRTRLPIDSIINLVCIELKYSHGRNFPASLMILSIGSLVRDVDVVLRLMPFSNI
jgi:hypothetical protein